MATTTENDQHETAHLTALGTDGYGVFSRIWSQNGCWVTRTHYQGHDLERAERIYRRVAARIVARNMSEV